MAVPKKRHSTQRKGKRRARIKLVLPSLGKCPNCQQPVRPHTVCQNCGYYKGRDILKFELKKGKDEKKRGPQTPKTKESR